MPPWPLGARSDWECPRSLTAIRLRRDVWITDAGSLAIIRRGADASNNDLATIIAKPVE
jgi:hypothetical protein